MDLDALREQLDADGLLLDVHILDAASVRKLREKRPGITAGLAGTLQVLTHEVDVLIGLPKDFPRALPLVYLEPWDVLGLLPHVDRNGNVCYLDAEGVLLDHRDPQGLVAEAVALARDLLENGVTGKNQEDFLDEFDAYWAQLGNLKMIESFVEPYNAPRKILLARDAKNQDRYVADDYSSVEAFYRRAELQQFTIRNAMYVPLAPAGVLLPPKPPALWSVDELRDLVFSTAPSEHHREIERLATQLDKREELVVLSIPRPSGGRTLVAVNYYGIPGQHPLLSGGTASKVIPVRLHRKDRALVLPRGGAKQGLNHQRVLLVGCGAIGGFLAFQLAQTGVLNLTLVDPQRLGTENTYRHRLGMRYIGRNKSEAVHQEFEETLPYLNITSHVGKIEDLVSSGTIRLGEFDLIITGLGLPNVERWINEVVQSTAGGPPLIVSWLEPHGIGGHAILARPSTSAEVYAQGCYECLFRSGWTDGLYNTASFAAPEQSFAQNVTGCGSLYTPFGALDAIRTAEVATRLAVRTLEGREEGNPLISWKGDPTDFLDAGFVLSSRFELDEAALHQTRYTYPNPRCPVCQQSRAA